MPPLAPSRPSRLSSLDSRPPTGSVVRTRLMDAGVPPVVRPGQIGALVYMWRGRVVTPSV